MKNKLLFMAMLCLNALSSRAQTGPITGFTSVCNGATRTLQCTPSGGTWSSSNSSVVSVGLSSGVITGTNTKGSVTITYTLGGYTSTITASSFRNSSDMALNISLSGPMCQGQTTTFQHLDPGGSWSSSNTTQISINAVTGVATAPGYPGGGATIMYSFGGSCYRTKPSVTIGETPTLTGSSTVCAGAVISLTPSPDGGTWSSSDTTVATVGPLSTTNPIFGVSPGTAIISHTHPLSGCSGTKLITVNAAVSAITGGSTAICLGNTATFSNATPGGKWRSSDSSVVTVDSTTGVATGVGVGTAIISYTAPGGCGGIATVNITVHPNPAPISGSDSVCEGGILTFSDVTGGGAWSSSNTAIATINSSGIITTHALHLVSNECSQSATITYSLPTGCRATKDLKVNDNATGFNPLSSTTLCFQQRVNIQPYNDFGVIGGCYAGHAWYSTNSSIATVSAGPWQVVAGNTAGTVTISYSRGNGCWISMDVTVDSPTTYPITGPADINNYMPICLDSTDTLSNLDANGTGIWTQLDFYADPNILTITSQESIGSTATIKGLVAHRYNTPSIRYTVNPGTDSERCSIKQLRVFEPFAEITGPLTVCKDSTIVLDNAAWNGKWRSSNDSVATVSPNSNHYGFVHGISPGTAIISYTTACGIATVEVTVTTCSARSAGGVTTMGVGDLSSSVQRYSLFPNPGNGILTIRQASATEVSASVKVLNYTGVTVFTGDIGFKNGQTVLDLERLPAGMYILSLIDHHGNSDIFKVTIEK